MLIYMCVCLSDTGMTNTEKKYFMEVWSASEPLSHYLHVTFDPWPESQRSHVILNQRRSEKLCVATEGTRLL